MTTDRDRVEAATRAICERSTLSAERAEMLARIALAAADALAPPPDQDRVEAAIDAFYAVNRDDWRDSPVADATFDMMSRALAAADALAPPPVPLDREAVALAIHEARYAHPEHPRDPEPWDKGDREYAFRLADRVLALLPAAPPPVPEDVRWDWRDAWCAYRDAHVGLPPPKPMDAFVAGWEALRQLPAPPADTGDEVERLIRERDAARSLREWTKGKWDEDWKKFAATYDELKARAEAAEKGRDGFLDDSLRLHREKCDHMDRWIAAEARLAWARADALEEAAKVAEQDVTTYNEGMSARDVRLSHTRGPRWTDGPAIAKAIRTLADSEPAGRAALAAEGE